MHENWRPDLSDESVVLLLKPRCSAYYNILQYCRHIGVDVVNDGKKYWVARVRRKDGGYLRKRLCIAADGDYIANDFAHAVKLAEEWFQWPSIAALAAEAYQVGSRRDINICPIGSVFTVGHALRDYVDWKLIAATRSHFETIVSLINYHLVPRVSHIPLNQFDGVHFHKLAVDVLQTPPKLGRKDPTIKLEIRELSQDQLRRRKKTFNALVSILRGAFDLAWERGHLEDDRPRRCLQRLPNVDRPRVIFLNRQECRTLLANSRPDFSKLIRGALYTGCRASELVAMRVRDYCQNTSSLFVASPKGRRTRHVILPSEAQHFFAALLLRCQRPVCSARM
ncbi:hypothetical protein SLH49_19975 [Cognatiyoonia sp. IB215446]|nr:hypothetical protein [Cognatiyoonia sp. IB215446]MDX8350276.1 hypothetical protein [Cognatiyoonia sp. IB215446]